MKERPIIFSGEMVRAILIGRKTMTRRIIKDVFTYSPWQKGRELWVRETFASISIGGAVQDFIHYRSTPSEGRFLNSIGIWVDEKITLPWPFKWNSPIFMPRWASRINLEITEVRVERLQEISEEDAKKEGVEFLFTDQEIKNRPELGIGDRHYKNYLWHGFFGQQGSGNKQSDNWDYQLSGYKSAKDSFSSLWESISGRGSWGKSPWVWVISFRRLI